MHNPKIIKQTNIFYPTILNTRLGKDAPKKLWAIGDFDLLALSKIAFFCSTKCPGNEILKTLDQAQKWRDTGQCVISGFHSPIEKECLDILLRGNQPIIICPARNIENMRIPKIWQKGIEAKRLLLLSPFPESKKRVTAKLAETRNKMVAALADSIYFAHVSPGGKMEGLVKQCNSWGIQQLN